jgi:hypothetical protein
MLAGDHLITSAAGVVTGTPLATGEPAWRVPGAGRLLAAGAAGVFLLGDDRTVTRLDPAAGTRSGVGCAIAPKDKPWEPGRAYATADGEFVAVERLTGKAPTEGDNGYYWSLRPVALVQLYPPTALPAWNPKFGACPQTP